MPSPAPEHDPLLPLPAARAELARLRHAPVHPVRPLLVIGGWRSPIAAASLAARLRPCLAAGAPVLAVDAAGLGDIERIGLLVARRARALGPGPYDIAGVSMGGLVARWLADPECAGAAHVPAARIFTLATPHRGAVLARAIRPDRAASAMRPGSAFLRRLDARLPHAEYELICYAQRLDWWVGTWNTAPPGRAPAVAQPHSAAARCLSHFLVTSNPAILADLLTRLGSR